MIKYVGVQKIRRVLQQIFLDLNGEEIENSLNKGMLVLKNSKINAQKLLSQGGLPYSPLQIVHAEVSHLGINIDWDNFMQSPIIVAMDGISILANFVSEENIPMDKGQWAAEVLKSYIKMTAISELAINPIFDDQNLIFGLVSIIDSLQLVIKSLHIRVENLNEEGMNEDFGLGIVIEELRANSYNEINNTQGYYEKKTKAEKKLPLAKQISFLQAFVYLGAESCEIFSQDSDPIVLKGKMSNKILLLKSQDQNEKILSILDGKINADFGIENLNPYPRLNFNASIRSITVMADQEKLNRAQLVVQISQNQFLNALYNNDDGYNDYQEEGSNYQDLAVECEGIYQNLSIENQTQYFQQLSSAHIDTVRGSGYSILTKIKQKNPEAFALKPKDVTDEQIGEVNQKFSEMFETLMNDASYNCQFKNTYIDLKVEKIAFQVTIDQQVQEFAFGNVKARLYNTDDLDIPEYSILTVQVESIGLGLTEIDSESNAPQQIRILEFLPIPDKENCLQVYFSSKVFNNHPFTGNFQLYLGSSILLLSSPQSVETFFSVNKTLFSTSDIMQSSSYRSKEFLSALPGQFIMMLQNDTYKTSYLSLNIQPQYMFILDNNQNDFGCLYQLGSIHVGTTVDDLKFSINKEIDLYEIIVEDSQFISQMRSKDLQNFFEVGGNFVSLFKDPSLFTFSNGFNLPFGQVNFKEEYSSIYQEEISLADDVCNLIYPKLSILVNRIQGIFTGGWNQAIKKELQNKLETETLSTAEFKPISQNPSSKTEIFFIENLLVQINRETQEAVCFDYENFEFYISGNSIACGDFGNFEFDNTNEANEFYNLICEKKVGNEKIVSQKLETYKIPVYQEEEKEISHYSVKSHYLNSISISSIEESKEVCSNIAYLSIVKPTQITTPSSFFSLNKQVLVQILNCSEEEISQISQAIQLEQKFMYPYITEVISPSELILETLAIAPVVSIYGQYAIVTQYQLDLQRCLVVFPEFHSKFGLMRYVANTVLDYQQVYKSPYQYLSHQSLYMGLNKQFKLRNNAIDALLFSKIQENGLQNDELSKFIAPEIFEGAEPTYSADVYSLGCLVFFIWRSHAPQIRSVNLESGDDDITKSFDDQDNQMDGGFQNIIAQATQKSPQNRFESVEQFISEWGQLQ